MWDITRRQIVKAMQEQHYTNLTLGAKVGYSDSTIQRWLAEPKPGKKEENGKKTAPPYDVIIEIADILHLDIQKIKADIGEQEMRAAQKIDYAGTDELLRQFEVWKADHTHHCEIVIAHQEELHRREIAIKDAVIDHRDETIGQLQKNVGYLKEQSRRLRISLIVAALLCVGFFAFVLVLLMVNLPQLGAGGSILH